MAVVSGARREGNGASLAVPRSDKSQGGVGKNSTTGEIGEGIVVTDFANGGAVACSQADGMRVASAKQRAFLQEMKHENTAAFNHQEARRGRFIVH